MPTKTEKIMNQPDHHFDQVARELLHRLERYVGFDLEKPLDEIPAEIRTDIQCVALELQEAAREAKVAELNALASKYNDRDVQYWLRQRANEIEKGGESCA